MTVRSFDTLELNRAIEAVSAGDYADREYRHACVRAGVNPSTGLAAGASPLLVLLTSDAEAGQCHPN